MGQIAGRVTLKEVVKVDDVISLMRTQRLGQKYMRDLLTIPTIHIGVGSCRSGLDVGILGCGGCR